MCQLDPSALVTTTIQGFGVDFDFAHQKPRFKKLKVQDVTTKLRKYRALIKPQHLIF
jgi:hypothetical protein